MMAKSVSAAVYIVGFAKLVNRNKLTSQHYKSSPCSVYKCERRVESSRFKLFFLCFAANHVLYGNHRESINDWRRQTKLTWRACPCLHNSGCLLGFSLLDHSTVGSLSLLAYKLIVSEPFCLSSIDISNMLNMNQATS
jgi:hypothetical protein